MTQIAPMLDSTRPAGVQRDADLELLEALRRGEASATERLVARYGNLAYRLAIRLCGKEEDAEEVVQDAFLAVIRKVDTFRGEAAFGTWFYRIVANAALLKVRARPRGRFEVLLDEAPPIFDERGRYLAPVGDWSASLADASARTELRMTLTAAIEELPAEERAVLALRDVEGLSSREVAEALNLSMSTVKSRLHRARLFVRKRLGDAVLGGGSWHRGAAERPEAETGGER